MAELLVTTPSDGVCLLMLSRGAKRNALSRDLAKALQDEIRGAEIGGMRALVVAGEGQAFSSGADFADLRGDLSDLEFDSQMSALTQALTASALISFAAIGGACVGAGLDLAMACDFRVAAPDAFFALPAVKVGILYSPRRLAQLLPIFSRSAATRLLLLGERLNRDEAFAAGIITHLADQSGEGSALDASIALAARAVLLPAKAQRVAKGFVASFYGPDFNETYWEEQRLELLTSDERRNALRHARMSKT